MLLSQRRKCSEIRMHYQNLWNYSAESANRLTVCRTPQAVHDYMYIIHLWNWMNCLLNDLNKLPFMCARVCHCCDFLIKHFLWFHYLFFLSFDTGNLLLSKMCLIGRSRTYLYLKMVNFDAEDSSKCLSIKEKRFFFFFLTLSVHLVIESQMNVDKWFLSWDPIRDMYMYIVTMASIPTLMVLRAKLEIRMIILVTDHANQWWYFAN